MISHDKLVYDNSTNYHICNEELGEDRVRKHCHLSDTFRVAAHEVCNVKYKVLKRQGDKSLVKWMGYPKSFNFWIDTKTIVKLTTEKSF